MSSLAGVKIYIYEDTLFTGEPVFGELHVLDSHETILHYAGSSSYFRTISFWLLNVSDYNTLMEHYKAGDEVSFTGWLGTNYTVIIRELSVVEVLWDVKRPTTYVVLKVRAKLQRVA